ncbi:hypothetical protein [Streptomyces sp. S.PB5]|uniref:hypothetical protein n=1 Tax=Streptomyces sp. S.PB5 TaxID=3020844 RepID=UPI0025B27702|nr:hypothetical protein [Streptomyces sp. S.PB5]MDN3028258.1 hypothetical protein [Streptomyces sp. S.PB5]
MIRRRHPIPHSKSDGSAPVTDVYLLFAHEPYYPHADTQEINTTVVCADSLLHPRVLQPDGARIHDRRTRALSLGLP